MTIQDRDRLRSRRMLPALIALFWTLVVAGSLYWNIERDWEASYRRAVAEAQANHAKDLSFRRWATGHGGVYVPITPKQPPVPWLSHLPESVVTTTDGQKLALLNPASMLRQVMDRFSSDYGVRGRITGLKYLNPDNAPDAWERAKMIDFEQGRYTEVTEIVSIDGKPFLRYLKAMFMENEGCVRCHAVLGFTTVGAFRGAIGVNLPMDAYLEEYRNHRNVLALSHGGIWLLGFLGIALSFRQRERQDREKDRLLMELGASEARFRSLMETSPLPMLVTGPPPDSQVQLMNRRFVEVFGYDRNEVRDIASWWPLAYPDPDYRHEVRTAWDKAVGDMTAAGANHIVPVPADIACKDGSRRYCEVAMAIAADCALVIFNDLTERQHLERELLTLNADLERRVSERTTSLEQALKELESFSYSASHDLRTPLRAINGYAEILIDEEREKLSDDGKLMLDRIARSASRMGQLIDDILEYSRTSRQEMRLEPIDLNALVLRTVNELSALYPTTVVDVKPLPQASGDQTMLTQVLQNLIGNAYKFSAKAAAPRIEIGCRHVEGKTAVYVADNGTGFDMRYAKKLFGMFQRLHPDAEFPGTGVGLAIVKRLVERHDGHVWAESESGKGATFLFTLAGLDASASTD